MAKVVCPARPRSAAGAVRAAVTAGGAGRVSAIGGRGRFQVPVLQEEGVPQSLAQGVS